MVTWGNRTTAYRREQEPFKPHKKNIGKLFKALSQHICGKKKCFIGKLFKALSHKGKHKKEKTPFFFEKRKDKKKEKNWEPQKKEERIRRTRGK
jgi:hypothetical protein